MKAIYIARPVISPLAEIEALRRELKLAPKREKPHVTIVYSRTRVDWSAPAFQPTADSITISEQEYELAAFCDHIVLKLPSKDLLDRNSAVVAAGAKSDFDGYQPHLTLGTLTPESKVIPPRVSLSSPIVLSPEGRDARPEPKVSKEELDAAIVRAAVGFANDYGPLPAANAGDEAAQAVMAKRLVDILARQGLTILPK
jgi:hypothetical protein